MRFVMAHEGGKQHLGVVEGDKAIFIAEPASLMDVIKGGPAALKTAKAAADKGKASAKPLASLKYAQPIHNPGKVVCLGLNYAAHAAEGGHKAPDYPAFFIRVNTSLIAAGEPLIRPHVSEQLDYECELMVVIGKRARYVSEAKALDHVFGYTLFNDGSVRNYQRKSTQWTMGKNFDRTGPVGPVVVTPDELPPGCVGLNIETRLNGKVLQHSNTSSMLVSVAKAIHLLSEGMTLEPGDMIAMGTPEGVGHARKPPLWMKPGDVVEIEVEKIGILRNPVADEDGA